MRRALVVLLVCACARTAADPVAAGNGEVSDAGAGDRGDAGSTTSPIDAGLPDAGNRDAGDAGNPNPADAGPLDGGTAYSPIVDSDAGPMSLVIAPESGSSCASWLPQPREPEIRSITTQQQRLWWATIVSDGRGDLAVGLEQTWFEVGFVSDSGFSMGGIGGYIAPQANSFLFDNVGGPCLICEATLVSWPGNGRIALGNGYQFSRNCNYAPRSEGDGAYVTCSGPVNNGQAPNPTFERYDEFLNLMSSQPGDGLNVIAADTRDRILERNDDYTQWRWLDSSGNVISDFFPGNGWWVPARLIGGGFLDRNGRVIPSGSANVSQAPAWLTSRKSVSIVLGGRAYALADNDCGLEIRDPEGQLCGTMSFINCRIPPQPGFDGTVTFPMSSNGYVTEQTLVSWPGLLR